MAAPKKTTTKKPAAKKPAAKKATSKPPTKKATPAAKPDPIQETIEMVKGFQINTIIAIGLGLAFVFFQFFEVLQVEWWLNIFAAGAAALMFWLQSDKTAGNEQKICRWGLLLVLALFVLRDIQISMELEDYIDKYGDIENALS